MPSRSLDTYRHKRDPARTPEPFGAARAQPAGAGRFVVQQHAARRLHWDFRLEIEGVLASWAVPRGPSVDPKEKRLAVQTEDHPIEYADFEGIIPPGNYGAGAVIVWDRGTYESADGSAPADGLARGKLDLELRGLKLRGRWALVRTKGSGKDWLLFKKADAYAGGVEPVAAQPTSVFSGLTVSELQEGRSPAAELAALAAEARAPRRRLTAADCAPMLAGTADGPFSRAGWIFELKYDGVRVVIARQSGETAVRLRSRTGRDLSATFPEIAAAAAHLPADGFAIDGEVIAVDDRGSGSFERLQRRLGQTNPWAVARAAAEVPVLVYAFDLLAVAGHDLRPLPLTTRKALLRRLLPPQGLVRFADHVEERGREFFDEASAHGVEGVVAKRADSPYRSGRRSRDWLKIKVPRTADLTVVGFLPGKGSRQALGSLMLAWRRPAGSADATSVPELVYAGNVGSGLDTRLLDTLLATLRAATRPTPAFTTDEPLPRGAVFVEPRLVAEVAYAEVTERGLLRQPVFRRLRDDKTVAECDARPEKPTRAAGNGQWGTGSGQPEAGNGQRGAQTDERAREARVVPTNLAKVFWPDEGYTKGDLLAYYEAVWPAIGPYLRDRPVVLTRYPDGIAGKSFFQKNAPEFVPDWVPTCRIEDTEHFLCNDLDALRYVINLGCIPLHVWSARQGTLEHPDWAILDLDPKGAPFAHVVRVARHIHRLLAPVDAPHFVKTSGQDGLHILLPLGAALTHDEAKSFAEVLARLVAAELPDVATVARPLGDRGGKVYVDFLQNGFGKTIVAPFSVRPRPGAPVSTPLAWSEVSARLDPARFTIRTVLRRLATRPDPMAAVLHTRTDVHAVLAALGERLGEAGPRA